MSGSRSCRSPQACLAMTATSTAICGAPWRQRKTACCRCWPACPRSGVRWRRRVPTLPASSAATPTTQPTGWPRLSKARHHSARAPSRLLPPQLRRLQPLWRPATMPGAHQVPPPSLPQTMTTPNTDTAAVRQSLALLVRFVGVRARRWASTRPLMTQRAPPKPAPARPHRLPLATKVRRPQRAARRRMRRASSKPSGSPSREPLGTQP